MSKPKLTDGAVDRIRSELSESMFFQPRPDSPTPMSQDQEAEQAAEQFSTSTSTSARPATNLNKARAPKATDTVVSRHHDTMTPAITAELLESIRQAVRQVGKEAATHRFTQAEKQALRDIEYAYQSRGIRTSENEITRIAVNHLVEDYQEKGEDSILAKVLERLNR